MGNVTKIIQPELTKPSPIKIRPCSQSKVLISKAQPQTQPKTLLQEATLKQSKVQEAKPLEEIIARSGPDEKAKVGVLDYLRTPDRVFRKIGLEEESTANFLFSFKKNLFFLFLLIFLYQTVYIYVTCRCHPDVHLRLHLDVTVWLHQLQFRRVGSPK